MRGSAEGCGVPGESLCGVHRREVVKKLAMAVRKVSFATIFRLSYVNACEMYGMRL